MLVVRVHKLVPRDVWSDRYRQIHEFEQPLTETGTTIVKFFLYIDRDEQRQRFQERYDDPTQALEVLARRPRGAQAAGTDYIAAYEDVLSKTSTDYAPWYVIPANRNWLRNLAVASILAETIDELKPAYPPAPDLPADLVIS